ncbi:MAG: hypothetical protein VX583_04245 [Bdellovibrionota bacterium]|nr:hypothetical protein [Pseudobdellovibrionaceae bacterium]|tara:strand:- start:71881 stop:72102 length:222 start_codon:yes stop_codon:yes gene_type:complete
MLNHYSLESFGPHWINLPHLDFIIKKIIKAKEPKAIEENYDLKKQIARENYLEDLKIIKEREMFTGSSGLYLF